VWATLFVADSRLPTNSMFTRCQCRLGSRECPKVEGLVLVTARRFPPPVEERQACFIVKDGNGQALAYVYFEEEPDRRSAENLMSHDEAGALALNIAKLPQLLAR
jgi:hypothetical protein